MADFQNELQKYSILDYKNLFQEALLTPTTLKWEKLVNALKMKEIANQARLPLDENSFLLSGEYFRPVINERTYPFSFNPLEIQFIGGFAPYGGEFLRDEQIKNILNDALVLNLDSIQNKQGILPNVYRHEFAHKNLPSIYGERNYGYILPKDIQQFLSWYPPQQRGEELKAEIFAGRNIPNEIISSMRRELLY